MAANAAGPLDILQRAATRPILPHVGRQSEHLVSLVDEERRHGRAVGTPAHPHGNALFPGNCRIIWHATKIGLFAPRTQEHYAFQLAKQTEREPTDKGEIKREQRLGGHEVRLARSDGNDQREWQSFRGTTATLFEPASPARTINAPPPVQLERRLRRALIAQIRLFSSRSSVNSQSKIASRSRNFSSKTTLSAIDYTRFSSSLVSEPCTLRLIQGRIFMSYQSPDSSRFFTYR